ncbi:hypothetical protein V9T40_004601 [Parthenolecanium corni]|uniref:Uncharacterized protein n=1 Tax=Parthenolecanium corni TaxID=536013 RepID=A0AAN9U3M7_9HEMI
MRVPSVPNDVRCNPADNCERGAKKQFNNRNKKNDDATRRDARNVDAVRYPTDIYDRGAAHLRDEDEDEDEGERMSEELAERGARKIESKRKRTAGRRGGKRW